MHKTDSTPATSATGCKSVLVIDAQDRGIPIRIGVNEGSIIERRDKQVRAQELGRFFSEHRHGQMLALMIAKLEEYLDIFHAKDFHDLAISAKSMDTMLTVDAYTEIAKRFDYPLHLGVTHAGPKETGCIRSVVALGSLLQQGIGDTIESRTPPTLCTKSRTAPKCSAALACVNAKGPN